MNFTEYLIFLDEALGDNARKILSKNPTTDQMGGPDMEKDHHEFVNDTGMRARRRVERRFNEAKQKGYLSHQPSAQKSFDLSQKMSDRDLGILDIYAGDEHEPINRLLRDGKPDRHIDYGEDDSFYNANVDFAKGLYQAVKKLPKEEGTFYRGLNSQRVYEKLKNLNVGDEIDDQGFGSYSSKLSTALEFNTGDGWDALMKVRGNRFRDFSPLSPTSEQERLLLPGARMQLVEKLMQSPFGGPEIPTYLFDLLDEEEEDPFTQE